MMGRKHFPSFTISVLYVMLIFLLLLPVDYSYFFCSLMEGLNQSHLFKKNKKKKTQRLHFCYKLTNDAVSLLLPMLQQKKSQTKSFITYTTFFTEEKQFCVKILQNSAKLYAVLLDFNIYIKFFNLCEFFSHRNLFSPSCSSINRRFPQNLKFLMNELRFVRSNYSRKVMTIVRIKLACSLIKGNVFTIL